MSSDCSIHNSPTIRTAWLHPLPLDCAQEVNSSAPRIREAVVGEVDELDVQTTQTTTTRREFAKELTSLCTTDEQFGGSYEIPSQTTIDLVIGEMRTERASLLPA